LGDGTTRDKTAPIIVTGPYNTEIIKVSAGYQHSMMLNKNGSVITFGRGDEGRLGTGSTVRSTNPYLIPNFEDIIDIDAGADHSLTLKKNGDVYAMGRNSVTFSFN
jgi:alpha-tubulin suppressor-like RCC1 family protein